MKTFQIVQGRSAELIGKHYKLFTDVTEVTNKDKSTIEVEQQLGEKLGKLFRKVVHLVTIYSYFDPTYSTTQYRHGWPHAYTVYFAHSNHKF